MNEIEDQAQLKKAPDETPLEGFASLCIKAALALFAFTFIFQNFVVPSSSMAKTILVGDHVTADRSMLAPRTKWAPFLPYREVRRGDIIVFYKPVVEERGPQKGEHATLVKRVVGIPGDRIHLRNGIVYLNGVAQNEPLAAKPTFANYNAYVDDFPLIDPAQQPGVTAEWAASLATYVQNGDLVVPPGEYFAMGDNRDNSLDSRYWGFVPRENIIGRPLFTYWSIDVPEEDDEGTPLTQQASSTLHEFLHFFDTTRWSRTLHLIR
jgi:signal peptidase I